MGLTRTYRARGQPPVLQGRPQRTVWRPFCYLRTSVFPSAICLWLGVGAQRRRGREREKGRGGRGQQGRGASLLCPPCLPPALLGALGAAGPGLPLLEEATLPAAARDHRGGPPWTSFLCCLLKPAFPLYRQDTQLLDPKRGPPPRGRAGLSAALAARRASRPRPTLGCPQPLLPLRKVPRSLQTHRLRPSAQTGMEATAPPCLRPPSRSAARSRERPVRDGGLRGRRGRG